MDGMDGMVFGMNRPRGGKICIWDNMIILWALFRKAHQRGIEPSEGKGVVTSGCVRIKRRNVEGEAFARDAEILAPACTEQIQQGGIGVVLTMLGVIAFSLIPKNATCRNSRKGGYGAIVIGRKLLEVHVRKGGAVAKGVPIFVGWEAADLFQIVA